MPEALPGSLPEYEKMPTPEFANSPAAASATPLRQASVSLDLDNLWSYLKVHGDKEWEAYPSYLDLAVPVILEFLAQHRQTITFFVVGQDAMHEENASALSQISRAGHEIGNHSIHHESWLHTYSEERVVEEISGAEEAILAVTGYRTRGFRGPGFAYSPTTLSVLKRLGYEFDASLLPSSLGPLARLYYMWGSGMSKAERATRKNLFGRLSDGFLPLKPFEWNTPEGGLLEIPVTTMPVFRFPFHLSYIMWLSKFSTTLARTYFHTALMLCRLRGVEPSFLLHPLDFLGKGDVKGLKFFPAMEVPRQKKLELAGMVLKAMQRHFDVIPMGEHARRIRQSRPLRSVVPAAFEA